jgi:HEAT repeat protein
VDLTRSLTGRAGADRIARRGARAAGGDVTGRVRRRLAGALGASLLALAACGSDARRPVAPEYDLRHPSASRRLEAIAVTVATRDAAQVPVLFDLLDDGDEAVRLSAASALRAMVGGDPGYAPHAPRDERVAMAAAWRAAWSRPAPAPTGSRVPSAGYTGSPGGAAR